MPKYLFYKRTDSGIVIFAKLTFDLLDPKDFTLTGDPIARELLREIGFPDKESDPEMIHGSYLWCAREVEK